MKRRILSVILTLCLSISSQSVAYAYQGDSLLQKDVLTEEITSGSDTGDDENTATEEESSLEEDVLTEETTDEPDTGDDENTATEEESLQEEDVLTEETMDEPDIGDEENLVPEEGVSLQEEDILTEEMTVEPNTSDSDGDIPTPTEVYNAMIALKDQDAYKEGTTWTNYEPYSDSAGLYHWKGGTLGGVNISAAGCVAFAFILSDAAFGSLPNRMYAAGGFSYEDIKVGDILRVNGDAHTVIVLEVSDVGVVVAEGNYSGKVHWGRAVSKEEVMSSTSHYITRYPEGYVSPDDPTANDIIGEGTLDGGLKWNLTKAGTLTISGSGAMPDFSSAGEQPWNSYNSQIRKVVIENGVTGIGNCAFWECGVLSAEISSSVTMIGNSAFRGSSIISVTIPSGVTTIGDSAFRECQNLGSVTISEGVETIVQNAFRACTSLTSIALPASIGEVGAGAFFQCTALTSATFASGNKQVKMGDDMFSGCWYLVSVTLPTSIDRISERMFQNCQMLPEVIIPQGVESIGGTAFASCYSLTTVFIPDSVTTIGTAAFSACPLTDIYFTGTEAQWNGISKLGDTASKVSEATIHYNYKPGTSPDPDDGTSSTEYVVTFVVGSDTYSEKYEVGSLISKIPDGVYELVGDVPIEGLYTNKLFTAKSKWNQSTSVVLANTTLYVRYAAQISEDEDGNPAGVRVQAIPDQVYTGADIKPDVVVYAVDGTLLKKNKDYTITYTKNATTKANIDENGNPIEGVAQPYLTIKGKGNYDTESVTVNFNIVPASIGSGDTFATGFTAKINESIVLASKPTAAVTSLKYKKAMTLGTDYTVEISNNGNDQTKGVTTTADTKKLPAVNEQGNYTVTITGRGNYCGTVTKTISASDKNHLLSNATVKIGSSIKKIKFTSIGTGDGKIDMSQIASGEKTPDADKFSVIAKTNDTLATDLYTYKVVYANGSTTTPAVGKAQLIITAKADSGYFGSKSVTFTVVGTAAKNNVIVGDSTGKLADVVYTGAAHTEYNNVEVRTKSDNKRLVHKKDYTITYKNNIKKGTATMTFTMLPESGYTGSIKVTFKITAATITTDLIENVSEFIISGDTAKLKEAVSYSKAGVKPSNKISMCLDSGYVLKEGTDYTVSYKNNTTIPSGTKVPTMTIKGKGNFTGSYTVTFDIKSASLEELYQTGDLVVTVTSQEYKPSAKTYAIKVKVKDGSKTLSVKKDYVLGGPTEAAAVDAYLHADGACPKVTISGGSNGYYTGEISVPLSFYDSGNKMTAKNVTIAFKESKDPNGVDIDAYYRNGVQVTMDDYLLVYFTDADGNKELLDADSYTVTWGKNNTAGNKKGTVTITGQGKYGGSVKCTFNIMKLGLTTGVAALVTCGMSLQKTSLQLR